MPGSILGTEVRRTEDPRLLTGLAQYLDDLPLEGGLYAAFVRSTIAHARVNSIDTAEAAKMPGVVGVYVASDLGLGPMMVLPMFPAPFGRPILASEVVRFVGEPVAMVVAETRTQATDAAESVAVDYDPLPAVVDPEAGLASDATLLFPDHGSNVPFALELGRDESVMEDADVVVKARFVNQRLAPVPMEPNGAAAAHDPETGGVKIWCSSQAPFGARDNLTAVLGLPPEQVHVLTPHVGGGFGAKITAYPEWAAICKVAMDLKRPVKWFETRSENMVNMFHGRAQIQDVELGAKRDGTFTGLRVHVVQDVGAYPAFGPVLPTLTRQMACGVYTIPKAEFNFSAVVTNTTTTSAYRGAGRPEATALLERIIDMLSVEIGMDPAEVRRKNLIPKDAFPHTTVTGGAYDIGDYELALDEALKASGYEQLRKEQSQRRATGDVKQLGIGLSVYVEITGAGGPPIEFGSVEVHDDGTVTVLTGTSPHGQGHETSWAMIVADTLGVPIESVKVLHSDTHVLPRGGGTMGSRSLQQGGAAVLNASRTLVEKAKLLAAHLLEASPDDIQIFDDGRLGVAGTPTSGVSWGELSVRSADPSNLPDGMEPGLKAATDFDQGGATFPFGSHVAVVEVDTQTGDARLLRHIAVDDCGKILNPMLVRGQVHGGVAQGVAQAMYEEFTYDADGNPLNSTLATYAFPSAAELPSIESVHTETPTPMNPLGAKGIGESGTIGSTPAVQNAVVDALSHVGVKHIDMPLSPERVWRAIRDAGTRA